MVIHPQLDQSCRWRYTKRNDLKSTCSLRLDAALLAPGRHRRRGCTQGHMCSLSVDVVLATLGRCAPRGTPEPGDPPFAAQRHWGGAQFGEGPRADLSTGVHP
eukprot:1161843-Pelagomonas_calceolata.AAC.6